jgi:hypothetical protein
MSGSKLRSQPYIFLLLTALPTRMNKSLLKWREVIALKVTEELAQCLPDVHCYISKNEWKIGSVAEGHLSHLNLPRLKKR